MLCPILATYDHTDKRWCPTYHEDTEKIQSPDLKKSSWQIHPYSEPFYTPLSGSRPVHFMSSTVHICVCEKIKSRVEKLTQKHPDVLGPFFQQEAKQIWLSGFPVKAKELLEAVMNTSPPPWHPQPDTHTLTQAHTHTHAHTNGKAENPNRKGDLQSHPSFFLCFSNPEEPCLCGCAQPPLYCLAVSSYHLRLERAQLEAWLHQSAYGRRWCHSPGCIIPI